MSIEHRASLRLPIESGAMAFPPFDGSAPQQQEFSAPPEMGIDPAKRYTATMTTSLGEIVIALDALKAPKTVNNFVFLALNHYYDGVIFHRIINGFMCQGGDFTNHNGTGGISIYGAKFPDENFNIKHNKRGLLSMANAGPNTNGSQFFITFGPTDWLNGAHVVFGELVEGDEVLRQIEACGSRSGKTSRKLVIEDCGEIEKQE